ncbi:hypothetical protein IWQ60_004338 [Tieghemiomyces parasiticus]|uniref:Uncharacterized protein n=1 Tax=Tieghemiomyces parasiticus TaxID=78921 RepID=A0A9W8ABL1_9FUNG|nr:hypothetical protein IWQ60_004338 [Tieghemiomyces parasiticus]
MKQRLRGKKFTTVEVVKDAWQSDIPTDPCADHVLNYVVYRLLFKCTSVSSEDFSTARAIMRSIQDTGLCYGGMASDMFACHVNVSFDPAQLDDFLAVPNVTGYELI